MCIVDHIEIVNVSLSLKMNLNELQLMRERYLKLVDVHGQLQSQNSLLEERILSIVETYAEEKSRLEQALDDAKERIGYLQETVNELQIDKQRYKDDCNLAVRLLHRYPNEFISTTSGQIPKQLKNRYESVGDRETKLSMGDISILDIRGKSTGDIATQCFDTNFSTDFCCTTIHAHDEYLLGDNAKYFVSNGNSCK